MTPTVLPLPVRDLAAVSQFVVPPFATAVQIATQSNVPLTMDVSPALRTPDGEAVPTGNQAVATQHAPDSPASQWSFLPREQGPFLATPTGTTFDGGAATRTPAFDPDANRSAGNLWSALEGTTGTCAPLVVQPGPTGALTVAFTDTERGSRTVSSGHNTESFTFSPFSADQIAALPSSYH